jgi:HEAT repeat protein
MPDINPIEPDYSGIIRMHAQEKKRGRRRLVVLAVLLALLGCAGYYGYYRYLRFDHLVSKLDLCAIGSDPKDPGLVDDCKAAVEDLSGYGSVHCGAFVTAITAQKNVNQRNLLLHALLKGTNATATEGMEGDDCLEEAILEVHKKTCRDEGCRPMGFFVARPEIWGVASYNQALIPWGIHVRLLDQLDLKSVTASLQTLGVKLEQLLGAKDPEVRKATGALARKHIVPALEKTYAALAEGRLTPGSALAAREKPLLPKNLAMMLAAAVPPGHPLAKRILDHLLQKVIFAADTNPREFRLHIDFLNRALKREGWAPLLKPRLEKLRKRSYRQLLLLLGSLDPGSSEPARARLEAIYTPWVERLLADEDEAVGADPNLAKIAAAAPTVDTAIRLLMRRPRHDIHLEETLANLARRKRDPSELIRRILVVLLHSRRRCPRPASIERDGSWLVPEFKWLFRRFGKKLRRCRFPAREVWQPLARAHWPAEVRQRAIRAAKTRKAEEIEALISDAKDANARFFGFVALSALAPEDRLELARSGLKDPVPSVRAAAALAAGYRVRKDRDFARLASLLTPLSKDKSWTVRFAAFSAVARWDEVSRLYAFLNDDSPLVVRRWKKLAASWDRDRVKAFVSRRDRGAGVAVAAALGLGPPESTLLRLARHKSEMVRAELTRALAYPDLEADLDLLFKDRSPWVRHRALVVVTAMVQNPRKFPVEQQLKYLRQAAGLLGDPVFEVQRQAETVFTSIADPRALPHLAKLAHTDDCAVKRAALVAIARLNKMPAPSIDCSAKSK